jgi:hypothetical protein
LLFALLAVAELNENFDFAVSLHQSRPQAIDFGLQAQPLAFQVEQVHLQHGLIAEAFQLPIDLDRPWSARACLPLESQLGGQVIHPTLQFLLGLERASQFGSPLVAESLAQLQQSLEPESKHQDQMLLFVLPDAKAA